MEQVEHVARRVSDRFRSAGVRSGVHEEGSGGGERWNYASVHLTECDESDRNAAEAGAKRVAASNTVGTRVIQPQPWN